MMSLRPFALLLMVALLIAGQWGMAQNRLHAQPVGYVELCHGFETSVIAIDAKGREVPEHAHCPDCVPSLASLPWLAAGPSLPGQDVQISAPHWPSACQHAPLTIRQHHTARAPPIQV